MLSGSSQSRSWRNGAWQRLVQVFKCGEQEVTNYRVLHPTAHGAGGTLPLDQRGRRRRRRRSRRRRRRRRKGTT